MQDYHCGLIMHCDIDTSSSTPYPLSQVLSYAKLSPPFRAIVLSASSHFEPEFYSHAAGHPEWEKAMSAE